MVFNHNPKLKKGNVPRGGRREPGRGADGVTEVSGDQAGHLHRCDKPGPEQMALGAGEERGSAMRSTQDHREA